MMSDPNGSSDPFDSGRWTVDNSESRFTSRLAAQSPARSILKGSRTPNPYSSPRPSQLERRQQQLQQIRQSSRHVSFSPFDRVRLFGEEDASYESGHERLHSRGLDSSVFDADPVASPPISDHPFLSRLTGSPSDQRKRRPDLFGSPPTHEENSPKRRFTERMHRAESQIVDDDDDDDEPTSFNNYMAGRNPPSAAELFEEVTDNEQEEALSAVQDENVMPPPRLSIISDNGSEMDLTQQTRQSEMEITQQTQQMILQSPKERTPFSDLGSGPKSTPRRVSVADAETREEMLDNLRTNIALNAYTPRRDRSSFAISDVGSDMEMTQEYTVRRSTLSRHPAQSSSQKTTPKRISQSPRRHFDKSPIGQRIASIAETLDNLSRGSSRYARSSEGSELGSVSDRDDILDEELSHLYESGNELEEPPSPPRSLAAPSSPVRKNIPLSEFLVYAKISFNDSPVANDRRRTSGFDTSQGPVQMSDQASAIATTVPELKMYRSYCEEVKDLISEDEKAIENMDKQVSTNNPSLFHEYFDDLSTQNQIDEKLGELKRYSEFKALQTVLEYKQTKTDALLNNFQRCLEHVSEDEQYLKDYNERLSTRLTHTQKNFQELAEELAQARQRKRKYDEINHEELESKLSDIKDQRATLATYRSDIANLTDRENGLLEKSNSLTAKRESLEAEIAKIEKELGSKVRLTERDLQRAKEHYDDCKKLSRLEPVAQTNELLKVTIMNDISVQVESPKTTPRGPVFVGLLEARNSYYRDFLPLVEGINAMVQHIQDVKEIVQTVAIYWSQARLIYRELYSTAGRFFIEYTRLESENYLEQGVRSTIVVSSYLHRAKITITLDLMLEDLSRIPAINTDRVNVELNHSRTPVTQSYVREFAIQLLQKEGWSDLKESLKKILEQVYTKHK